MLLFVEHQVVYCLFLCCSMSYFQVVFAHIFNFFRKQPLNRLKLLGTYKVSSNRLKSLRRAVNAKTRGVGVFDSNLIIIFIKIFIIFTQKVIQNLKCLQLFIFIHKLISFFCLFLNFFRKCVSNRLKSLELYDCPSLRLKCVRSAVNGKSRGIGEKQTSGMRG